jgi:hypothetical protein
VHVAKISTRDEIATMLCKRMAIIHKRARERLEVLRAQYRGESGRLLDAFGDVLAERSGGITALSATHEEVSAHHGSNYLPFVEKFYRGSRPGLFQVLDVLEFEPASAGHSVYDAMVFLRANRSRSGEYLSAKTGEKDGHAVEPRAWTSTRCRRKRGCVTSSPQPVLAWTLASDATSIGCSPACATTLPRPSPPAVERLPGPPSQDLPTSDNPA